MKWMTFALVVLCLVAIAASLVDLRCGMVAAGSNTLVVACSAGRL